MNKRIMLVTLSIPAFLFSCGKKQEKGVTFDLLWGVEIKPVEHNTKLVENQEYTTIAKYNKDGSISNDFKIMVITDPHLDPEQYVGNATYTTMMKNIMDEKPDFVAFCGDICTRKFNKERSIQLAEAFEKMGIYWSGVLGNHEGDNATMARQEMIDMWSKYDHCLMDPAIKYTADGMPVWGVGNHVINILGNDNKVAQSLFFLESGKVMTEDAMKTYKPQIQWMIDNGKNDSDDEEFYDYIKDSQVSWYIETFNKIKNDSPIANSTVFSHNPIKDMEDAYLECYAEYKSKVKPGWTFDQGIGKDSEGNWKIWPFTEIKYEAEDCDVEIKLGRRREDMCYSPHDVYYTGTGETKGHTPIFNAMKNFGGPHPAFFCGHDHLNDFVLEKDGVTLGYIEPATYSTYNLFTKGLLGEDPYKIDEFDDDKLIEGYSVLNYNLSTHEIASIEHKKNFEIYDGEHNEEITRFIDDLKGPYHNKWDTYPQDPNNPNK